MDAITTVPVPANEPVRTYPAGSAARAALIARCDELAAAPVELTAAIGGERRHGGGPAVDVVMPHDHKHVLGTFRAATEDDTRAALAAGRAAAPGWRALGFDARAAVFLRAAQLLAGPWRDTLNAATMLGQSKTAYQAEIDAACELIDFWRFNVAFARQILAEQPASPARRLEPDRLPAAGRLRLRGHALQLHLDRREPADRAGADGQRRPLEAGPHPAARRALRDGAPRCRRAAAGRDQHGSPATAQAVSEAALAEADLAGIHFTGSTGDVPAAVAAGGREDRPLPRLPRLVGETGGKDFVLAHPSADPAVLRAALLRGAFEYQGQKCSAASRAYVARSCGNGSATSWSARPRRSRRGTSPTRACSSAPLSTAAPTPG